MNKNQPETRPNQQKTIRTRAKSKWCIAESMPNRYKSISIIANQTKKVRTNAKSAKNNQDQRQIK